MIHMELHATPSRIARSLCRKARTVDYSLFEGMARRYAQYLPANDMGTLMDPTQLQSGQPVYDPEGEEWLVVGDPDQTTDKVVMPADQQGTQIPQGVTTVEDAELASEYSLQPPASDVEAHRIAQDVLDLGRGVLPERSSLEFPNDMSAETDKLRLGESGYVEIITAIQDMQDAGYGTVDVVLNIGEMFPRELGERVLAEARRRGIL